MKNTVYNKLVRDKIPKIIEQSGKRAVTEIIKDVQYINLLNTKLGEELTEYIESGDIEELADLVEVVYAILDFKNVPVSEFEKIRLGKAEKRGAFKERLLLKEVIED